MTINVDDLRRGYQSFFKTEAGQHFNDELTRLLVDCHQKAEEEPELSRDHVQRAKGVRLVKNHIDSVIAERSKPAK